MNPLYVDIGFAVLTLILLFVNYQSGFIKAAGHLIGLVLSIGLSIYGITWIEELTGYDLTSNVIVFIIAFLVLSIIINQILRFIVNAVDLVRRMFSIIPFVGLINSLLGAALGAVQAVLIIAGFAYVTIKYVPEGDLQNILLSSFSLHLAVDLLNKFGIL